MDKLHTTPVDRVAARVMRKGVKYEPATRGVDTDSENPIPTLRSFPRALASNPSFTDLTGRKFGRLTVMGLSRSNLRQWVCRCACGRYCVRHAAAIRNEANTADCCSHCRHLAFLKRELHYRTYGYDKDAPARPA